MSFSAHVRKKTDAVWEAIFQHPYVQALGDGSLPERKFRYWLHQDYLYLKDYARVFAYGATKAPDLETMGWFAKLFDGIVNFEMDGHRRYAKSFGVDLDELERGEMAPTCRAYTRELLYTAAAGSLGELTASLLPCLAGYAETATGSTLKGCPTILSTASGSKCTFPMSSRNWATTAPSCWTASQKEPGPTTWPCGRTATCTAPASSCCFGKCAGTRKGGQCSFAGVVPRGLSRPPEIRSRRNRLRGNRCRRRMTGRLPAAESGSGPSLRLKYRAGPPRHPSGLAACPCIDINSPSFRSFHVYT